MKLWQKIFLLTLLLTTLSVNSVSFILLLRSMNTHLTLAKEKNQVICETVISELENSVKMEKADTNRVILTTDQIESLLQTKIHEMDFDCQIKAEPIAVRYADIAQLPDDMGTAETFLTDNQNGQYILQTADIIFLEGIYYRISVTTDVTDLTLQFKKELTFAQWIGGSVALVTAAALLLASLRLTAPLQQLKQATEQITRGEYHNRVTVQGNDEIAELSEYMNIMTAKIEQSIAALEQLTKNREIFIANMAHEMKTPLTSILGFADILIIKSDMTEEERREYASIIAAEAKRLRLLSSKLMELISLSETELSLEPTNLKQLVEQAIEAFTPICQEKQCTLQSKLQPIMINADAALFTSLIMNLLDNALKASSAGSSIQINLTQVKRQAMLQVTDHGIGIPQEQLAYVTEAFYMVDKARSRSAGGSGIGLALCKAIVEAHHGVFRIESRENEGTTVSLLFPIAKKG